MKASELQEYIKQIRDEAIDDQMARRKRAESINCYGAGYDDGAAGTCQMILDYMQGEKDESE